MIRQYGLALATVVAVVLCALIADSASARHRNRGCGSHGGGWWRGDDSGGSFGSAGSFGSRGSFGGWFQRRANWGSHGGNGSYGSYGSYGSHGGHYNGNYQQGEVVHEGEVRYYGTREEGSSEQFEPAPAAPIQDEEEASTNNNRSNEAVPPPEGENAASDSSQSDAASSEQPQISAPPLEAPQSSNSSDRESVRDVTSERSSPPEERLRPQAGEATQ